MGVRYDGAMTSWSEFVDDLRPEDVALHVAVDAHPSLDRSVVRGALDALAAPLGAAVGAGAPGRAAALANAELADALAGHVYGTLGFRGEDDYGDARGNYLDDVIERRAGSPVALGVLLVAVGERAGIEVEPIGFPGHFLVRIGSVHLDPFDGGHPLDRESLLALATETLGSVRDAELRLEPVGSRTIAVRLLSNLLRIHGARGDHAQALVVCDRLIDVTGAPFHRADRGAHALALGATRGALADFEAYLAACPDADDARAVRALMARARAALLRPLN